jgi:hypothetical protein
MDRKATPIPRRADDVDRAVGVADARRKDIANPTDARRG